MERDNYTMAGWAVLGSVALFVPVMGLLVYGDIQNYGATKDGLTGQNLLPLVVLLDLASKALMIYAYLKFRELLNTRYDFHAVDRLIPILIVVGVITGALAYTTRAFEASVSSMVMGVTTGLIMGVLGIVYTRRLLCMSGNLNGYLKPLAYTYLAASICFLVVVFAPVGLILFRAADIILALVFFKGEELEQLEIV